MAKSRTVPTGRLRRDFAFDVREIGDDGVFEGYASVFNVVDSYGTVMLPGCFARTIEAWAAKGKPVPVLWQHDSHEPIGATVAINEDEKGLRVTGRLLVADVARAREAFACMKAEVVTGLSIGFSVPRLNSRGEPSAVWVEREDGTSGWAFNEVRLWEYSPVTFASTPEAEIDAVRSVEAFADAASEVLEAMRELRSAIVELRSDTRAGILPVDGPASVAGPSAQTLALTEAVRELRTNLRKRKERE